MKTFILFVIVTAVFISGCVTDGQTNQQSPASAFPSSTVASNTTSSQTTTADDSCSSNSDCGYKQICRNKKCQTVECTNNAHCSGCRRCSSNSCVSCGSGPYGCYC